MEWLLGGLVLLVLVAGGARARRGGAPLPIRPLPPAVLLVGDSHAQGLEPHLRSAFQARGVRFSVSFVVGSSARDWRREFLARALTQSSAPAVLLVLGTNDCASPELSVEFSGNLRVLLERIRAAGRSVLLLQPPGACLRVRSALEQNAAGAIVAPVELPMNGIHATREGYRLWADQIVSVFT